VRAAIEDGLSSRVSTTRWSRPARATSVNLPASGGDALPCREHRSVDDRADLVSYVACLESATGATVAARRRYVVVQVPQDVASGQAAADV